MSWRLNPAATQERLDAAGPIARLRGQAAEEQLARGRRFIQERPRPNSLYDVAPWPHALEQECVVSIVRGR
eukprot:3263317-Alexandrium_andersonii.AAC.1